MLAFRLIARLDVRNEHLIKTIRLEGVRKIGEPAEFVRRYDKEGIDEILYLDVVASLYGRNGLARLVEEASEDAFVPVTVGGGIKTVGDCHALFASGADKVAVNTGATARPELLTEIARKYGSQAVVLQLDAKRKGNGWEAYCDGGRQTTGRVATEWAREAVDRGAGEVVVTSIDREGTSRGCEIELVAEVVDAVSVPVVAAGGIGSAKDVVTVAKAGASGVAMAGALHFDRVKLSEIREACRNEGIPVR